MHSLSRRLLVSISVPLILFFGVMVFALDNGFRALSNRSLLDFLDAQMVALIAAVEPQPGGGYAPPVRELASRLRTPRSGLYAQIRSAGGLSEWKSPSTAGAPIDFGPPLDPGARRIAYTTNGRESIAIQSRGIQFEDTSGNWELTFSVAASLTPYEQELWRFRSQLFGWFIGLMLLLLATLAGLLRWVLAPVRRLEREIHEVEEGRSESLGEGYPRELSGVASNLNALLIGERRRVARYRDTLGNLAHSLKTPLAVMRSTLAAETAAAEGSVTTEIDRMSGIIEHQLKRAAASTGALLGQAPVEVAPIAAQLRAALLKVYAGKDLSLELAIDSSAQFVGDAGDLTEMLGNLLDNACKWCRSQVRLSSAVDAGFAARERLSLIVEDDGPGISTEHRASIGKRGVRADESVPGHGIGLSMVQETVEMYGGTLVIDASPLGGARFALRLPGRAEPPVNRP